MAHININLSLYGFVLLVRNVVLSHLNIQTCMPWHWQQMYLIFKYSILMFISHRNLYPLGTLL